MRISNQYATRLILKIRCFLKLQLSNEIYLQNYTWCNHCKKSWMSEGCLKWNRLYRMEIQTDHSELIPSVHSRAYHVLWDQQTFSPLKTLKFWKKILVNIYFVFLDRKTNVYRCFFQRIIDSVKWICSLLSLLIFRVINCCYVS